MVSMIETAPDPEQVVPGLVVQRDAWPDTGMDEEPLPVVVVGR